MDQGGKSYCRFLNGDDNSFVDIIREYQEGLILYLYNFTGNIHTAEDLAEDTFVRLVTKKPRFHAEKASFKTWLYTIGRNIALDQLRREGRALRAPLEDCEELCGIAASPESVYVQKEQHLLLHKALWQLKAEYRQVLWLIYFEDFSTKEAAAVLKKSVHNTETLIYRARLALKCELKKEDFIYEEL